MADLRLHREKGINPRLSVCASCGKSIGMILLGANEFVDQCNTCGLKHYGGAPFKQGGKRCQRCDGGMFNRSVIEEHDKIPAGVCTECQSKLDQMKEIVKEGGVYVMCEKCGSTAAIPKDRPEAVEARASLKVEPPAECGVSVPYCPHCKPEEFTDEPKPN